MLQSRKSLYEAKYKQMCPVMKVYDNLEIVFLLEVWKIINTKVLLLQLDFSKISVVVILIDIITQLVGRVDHKLYISKVLCSLMDSHS